VRQRPGDAVASLEGVRKGRTVAGFGLHEHVIVRVGCNLGTTNRLRVEARVYFEVLDTARCLSQRAVVHRPTGLHASHHIEVYRMDEHALAVLVRQKNDR
jgi:hypothetical protein